jgi:hypothetical protein
MEGVMNMRKLLYVLMIGVAAVPGGYSMDKEMYDGLLYAEYQKYETKVPAMRDRDSERYGAEGILYSERKKTTMVERRLPKKSGLGVNVYKIGTDGVVYNIKDQTDVLTFRKEVDLGSTSKSRLDKKRIEKQPKKGLGVNVYKIGTGGVVSNIKDKTDVLIFQDEK